MDVCVGCGEAAGAWVGCGPVPRLREGRGMVLLDASAGAGPRCTRCADALLASGKAAVTHEGGRPLPPSAMGRRAAVALFLAGFRDAFERSEAGWVDGETVGVSGASGDARWVDVSGAPVPLPGWMAATGPLWEAFSSGHARTGEASDLGAMGALYFLVTSRSVPRPRAADITRAADEAYARATALESRVRDALAAREAGAAAVRDG